jgi:uncharacterized membrane protein
MRVRYVEGDPCSPKYVAGSLRAAGHEVGDEAGDLLLLSDTPAAEFPGDLSAEVDRVERGGGLLLVGGWFSLGRGGYARSPLARILPVELMDGDDRVNTPAGLYLRRASPHPITDGLAFDRPPVVTGYNVVAPRGLVAIDGRVVEVVGDRHAVLSDTRVPLLVLGRHGKGRVAVLATDLAPHWSGGWTDWGRHAVRLEDGKEETGDAYVRFLDQLVRWVGGAMAERAEVNATLEAT